MKFVVDPGQGQDHYIPRPNHDEAESLALAILESGTRNEVMLWSEDGSYCALWVQMPQGGDPEKVLEGTYNSVLETLYPKELWERGG